ncbi:MAG: hypothetical protein U0930_08200 [Pirellulales bacterium]
MIVISGTIVLLSKRFFQRNQSPMSLWPETSEVSSCGSAINQSSIDCLDDEGYSARMLMIFASKYYFRFRRQWEAGIHKMKGHGFVIG